MAASVATRAEPQRKVKRYGKQRAADLNQKDYDHGILWTWQPKYMIKLKRKVVLDPFFIRCIIDALTLALRQSEKKNELVNDSDK